MSDLAKKIAGTYIADVRAHKEAVLEWVQTELRSGVLRPIVRQFIEAQPEIGLEQRLVLVDAITSTGIHCRIPFCVCDHESAHAFRSEIVFVLDPQTGTAIRH